MYISRKRWVNMLTKVQKNEKKENDLANEVTLLKEQMAFLLDERRDAHELSEAANEHIGAVCNGLQSEYAKAVR